MQIRGTAKMAKKKEPCDFCSEDDWWRDKRYYHSCRFFGQWNDMGLLIPFCKIFNKLDFCPCERCPIYKIYKIKKRKDPCKRCPINKIKKRNEKRKRKENEE